MHAQDAADLIALAIDAMRFGQLDAVRDEIVTKYGLIHTQVDHLTAWMTAGDGGRAGENDIVRGSSALAEGGAPGVAPVPDVLSTSVARLSFNSMAMSPLTADQSITTTSLMAAAGSKEIMAVLKALRLMQQREEPAGQILSYISVKRDLITVFGGAVFEHAKPHVQALLRDGELPVDLQCICRNSCSLQYLCFICHGCTDLNQTVVETHCLVCCVVV